MHFRPAYIRAVAHDGRKSDGLRENVPRHRPILLCLQGGNARRIAAIPRGRVRGTIVGPRDAAQIQAGRGAGVDGRSVSRSGDRQPSQGLGLVCVLGRGEFPAGILRYLRTEGRELCGLGARAHRANDRRNLPAAAGPGWDRARSHRRAGDAVAGLRLSSRGGHRQGRRQAAGDGLPAVDLSRSIRRGTGRGGHGGNRPPAWELGIRE